MWKYFIKRLLLLIPVMICLTFLIFSLMSLAPGDPGTAILGTSATAEERQAFNESVGFYDPFFVRYGRFLKDFLRGSFGQSYSTKQDVMTEIAERLPTSLKVATYAMGFAIIVGIPMGVFSAVKQYSAADHILRVVSVTLAAAPGFWLALMLILLFSIKLKWLPTYGAETWQHFILPMLALGFPYSARQMRVTRSLMLETIRMDYIRTVRAKGAPEQQVIWQHAFKNALLPILNQVASNFSALIGGAVLTESVFAMPGLGAYLTTAVNNKNVNSALGATVTMSLIFSLVMLAVDMLFAVIDPRIKARYKA